MKRIYLDNAATTPLHKEVLDAMIPFLSEKFGNPSSIYSYGREAKLAIENVRKSIAKRFGVHPSEIFFTSGATEATNAIIQNAVKTLGCKRIITSTIEHHAVLHSIDRVVKEYGTAVNYVPLTYDGNINYNQLEKILKENKDEQKIVCLMHANNEIGNMLNLNRVGTLTKQYNAYFFSDTVQSIGHYEMNFKETFLDFAIGTAHKFHGPKGSGFIYINNAVKINPLLEGGAQERNMRAGTENVAGIVGLGAAFEIAYQNLEKYMAYIQSLKDYFIKKLNTLSIEININGAVENSLFTVLNVSFPKNLQTEFLVMNLDINGICVSGGSACSSGTVVESHVIQSVYPNSIANIVPIRFSFSKYNTKDELDIVFEKIKKLTSIT